MTSDQILDWVFEFRALAPAGTERVTKANPTELQALARHLDILSVDSLEVHWTIRPWRKTGARVMGTLKASVTQACGVTLEPVAETVEEEIDMRLTTDVRMIEGAPGAEAIDIDPEGRDPPELFDGVRIRLGDIAREHLALGLDPYPRSTEATFDDFGTGPSQTGEPAGEGNEASPFSSLKHLADRLPGGQKN